MNIFKRIIPSRQNLPKYPSYDDPKELHEYFTGLSDDDLRQQSQGIKDLALTFKHPEALPSWIQLQHALVTQIMEERGLLGNIEGNPVGRTR